MRKVSFLVFFMVMSVMFLFIPLNNTFATEKKVNINTASVEELKTLKGIGDKIAQRIIDHRKAEGPFTKIEDIMNVKGIGKATFNRLKDQITVGSVESSKGKKAEDKKDTSKKSEGKKSTEKKSTTTK
jgi:comEA protein